MHWGPVGGRAVVGRVEAGRELYNNRPTQNSASQYR